MRVNVAATARARKLHSEGIERLRKAFNWTPPNGNVQHGGRTTAHKSWRRKR